MLAQQVSGHWRQLRQRIWLARMRVYCTGPHQDHAVKDENPRGFSDPRVIEAFMNMRCC